MRGTISHELRHMRIIGMLLHSDVNREWFNSIFIISDSNTSALASQAHTLTTHLSPGVQ